MYEAMQQEVVFLKESYEELDVFFKTHQVKKVFLVCGQFIDLLHIGSYFNHLGRLGIEVCRFSDFQPNPQYASVVCGVKRYHEFGGGLIFAVGGGSAIDVAKCIKLYANMAEGADYLKQPVVPNDICLCVMPTTAGTGSEATRFAVIYDEGEKKSISDNSCLPSKVFMDAGVLLSLPDYHKKAAMLDALCHGVESFWSIHSTQESQGYSSRAIRLILENHGSYLKNDSIACYNMMIAANLAGKAIDITKTTAGHAMCYKLTTLYGIAHGHAAALCVDKLWPYMLTHLQDCVDSRGKQYLGEMFEKLAILWGGKKSVDGPKAFEAFLQELHMGVPERQSSMDYDVLSASVNVERLENNPIHLNSGALKDLYRQIV